MRQKEDAEEYNPDTQLHACALGQLLFGCKPGGEERNREFYQLLKDRDDLIPLPANSYYAKPQLIKTLNPADLVTEELEKGYFWWVASQNLTD